LEIPLAKETDLAYVAIKKNANKHLIWTQRAVTSAEKTWIYSVINNVSGFMGEMSDSTTTWISGLPISCSFEGGTVTATKSSNNLMVLDFVRPNQWAQICYGSFKYDYAPGTTSFKNTQETTQYDVKKTWGNDANPPVGAEIKITLSATVPGTPTDDDPNPEPVARTLSDIGVTPAVITLNGGQTGGNDTTQKPWEYSWTRLPEYDKNGKKITYTAVETSYKIGSQSISLTEYEPTSSNDATYEYIVNNKIPDKEVSAKKLWNIPTGSKLPENTKVTLTLTAKANNSEVQISELGSIMATVVLDGSETTSWTYKWRGLPKYYNGYEVEYTVTETGYVIGGKSYNVANADVTPVTGYDFSFTNDLPKITLSGSKTWIDGGQNRPGNLTLELYTVSGSAPDEQETQKTLQSTNSEADYYLEWTKPVNSSVWTYTISNLPKYDSSGNTIKYRVKEVIPANYRAERGVSDGAEDAKGNIINADLINTELTDFEFFKAWTTNSGNYEVWPNDVQSITVQLTASSSGEGAPGSKNVSFTVTKNSITKVDGGSLFVEDSQLTAYQNGDTAPENNLYGYKISGLDKYWISEDGTHGEWTYTISEISVTGEGGYTAKYRSDTTSGIIGGGISTGSGGVIQNDYSTVELPQTGSIGSHPIRMIGLSLVTLAGLLAGATLLRRRWLPVPRKRRSNERGGDDLS